MTATCSLKNTVHVYVRTAVIMSSVQESSSSVSASTYSRKSIVKRSLVWEYFEYEEDANKSVCRIEDCEKSVPGKNPTNLKQHLRALHKSVFQKLCEREEAAKVKREEVATKKQGSSLKHHYQASLKETLAKRTVYSKDSPRYKQVTKKLAVFVGASNVPNSLVESLEFKDLIATLDPRYPVPGRGVISEEIEKILIELKAKMSTYISSANKIAITCDVWSKKGLTSSYLGITGHFYSRKDHRRHTATLAVRQITTSHTAENIRKLCDDVLSEWGIDPSKMSAIITDNCSNMVAAFKKQITNSDCSDDERDEEAESTTVFDSNDEAEFLDCEQAHNIAFMSYHRIGCFSHSLQLVVNKFQEISAYKTVLKNAHSIVRKCNSSTKATEMLVSLSGKKLTKVVLEQQGWDDLVASEWRVLTSIRDLLNPFAKFTQLLSGEDFTTLSCVVPTLMELNIHLVNMKSNPEVSKAASILQSDLTRRFVKYTSPSGEDHDPIMITATAVDLRYRLCLNSVQSDSVTRYLDTLIEDSDSSSNCSSPLPPEIPENEPPPEKRFKHLGAILERKQDDISRNTNRKSKWRTELEHFNSISTRLSEDEDPINFWVANESTYPILSNVCVDLLSIPASSAPVERTFSTAGESTLGKRNRLSGKNLEREILLRKNKHYL